MRSLSDYVAALADLFAWIGLWWQVQFLRFLISSNTAERDATTSKEVRAYLTSRIAEHQAALDRLFINNQPLIERRMQAKEAT
jgi:hypothetical protein